MKTALITIATGEKYRRYAEAMCESAIEFFPDAIRIIFTDGIIPNGCCFNIPSAGFPEATLKRYHVFLGHKEYLSEFDQIFYCDADMKFVAPLGDIFSDGLVATLHPGYVGTNGTPDTNIASTAYCNFNKAYYCGGFQGGDARAYLDAARVMNANIREDDNNGVMAVWHDESHWNRYLAMYPPTKVLSPSYCYPDVPNDYYRDKWRAAGLGEVKPILLALTKDSR